MTKNFNFDNIGKRLPYTMPPETFNEMEANVFATLKQDKRRKKSYRFSRWNCSCCKCSSIADNSTDNDGAG